MLQHFQQKLLVLSPETYKACLIECMDFYIFACKYAVQIVHCSANWWNYVRKLRKVWAYVLTKSKLKYCVNWPLPSYLNNVCLFASFASFSSFFAQHLQMQKALYLYIDLLTVGLWKGGERAEKFMNLRGAIAILFKCWQIYNLFIDGVGEQGRIKI